MCHPFIGMEGRNGMVNTVKKEGRDGGHAVKSGWYPSLHAPNSYGLTLQNISDFAWIKTLLFSFSMNRSYLRLENTLA